MEHKEFYIQKWHVMMVVKTAKQLIRETTTNMREIEFKT